ncbi:MAG: hypothetical protein QGI88_09040 [SAR202 cluster bacterium]|nr:hypothetical protein [SAR202 cluster bacterium]
MDDAPEFRAPRQASLTESLDQGGGPDRIAEYTFEGVRAGKLYLLPHSEHRPRVLERAQEVVDETISKR